MKKMFPSASAWLSSGTKIFKWIIDNVLVLSRLLTWMLSSAVHGFTDIILK